MNATKERWQTPRTAFERFVTDQYVAACVDTGKFVLDPNAISEPNGHYYLDLDWDGILDPEERNEKPKNSEQVKGKEVDTSTSYWGWNVNNTAIRHRLFPLTKGGDHWAAFEERWVSNRNHS